MLKDKGFVLVEVLWAVSIFSFVILSVVPAFQILIEERGHRTEEYKALMMARSEMEISQQQLIDKEYSNGPYQVKVDVNIFKTPIVEVQVMVNWKIDGEKSDQIILKKLVYQKP